MTAEKMKNRQTNPLAFTGEKISIKLIDDFPNHPFYVFDDDDMAELTESIRKNGMISPLIVRKKGERYELISGHRRKHACELLGHGEIACSIVDAEAANLYSNESEKLNYAPTAEKRRFRKRMKRRKPNTKKGNGTQRTGLTNKRIH